MEKAGICVRFFFKEKTTGSVRFECKISLRYFCLLPYGTWEFKSFTLSSVCEKVASVSGHSQTGDFDWIQLFRIHSYSLVKRELCPNLLNRMQNNEGWLTHFTAGVVSQFEIP